MIKNAVACRIVSLAFLFTFSYSSSVHAGDSAQFNIQIPTIEGEVEIDGKFDESQWQQAASAKLAYETNPGENIPAPVETDVKIFSTQSSLFISYIAKDPHPEQIRANLSDRDSVWGDDLVGIKLDTFNDARLAYQFFVNAYGVQMDSIENELTGNESDAWDGIWYSAAKRTESGYQVEIELPLRLLNFDTKAEQTWGIEFIRFYPRNEEHRLSSHQIDRNNNCTLCQLGVASGLADLEQGNDLQITPSLVLNRTGNRPHRENSEWDNENNIEPSLDVRWGITPSTLLSATLNPDFSQVETDAGQLDINSTFALFFPEKRAFFLDNKDYFDTQLNLLHTRNIGAPDYGLKLTSKLGDHTFATLITDDTNTNFLVPGNLSSDVASIDEKSHNFAGRYRFDFGKPLSIGALVTAKKSEDYHNYVSSLDVKYQPSDHDTFIAQYVVSDTEYPEELYKAFCNTDDCLPKQNCDLTDCGVNERVLRTQKDGSFSDDMYLLKYQYESRNWDAFAQYTSVGDDFRADLGFIEKVDFKKFVTGGGYTWYPTTGFFNEVRLSGDWDISHNQDNEKLEQEAEMRIQVNGQWQSYATFGVVHRDRVGRRHNGASLAIDGNTQMFTETMGWLYGNIKPSRTLFLEVDVNYGDDIDFANDQLGTRVKFNPGVNWKITDSIEMDLSHVYRTLDVDEGRLFTANLSDLRLSWYIDIHNFIRISSVYTDIERDQSLYKYSTPNAQYQQLGNEVLYGYKLNPQSVFYLGYSDGLKADDAIDSLMKTEETYFMKLSYAWLL
ncbi:carbohydrate binding family 9 domain-containing protein [Shewanella halifaxensis]|uniref:carbohydrate binding family 9 domain-containing protein n=1 Tax=Shewanella halifaxensis TaxID=271098 RepID=UPI000D58F2D2|nr:carbohydrate binding family 9 domain-containing protein [Shewanella halifaxensis]